MEAMNHGSPTPINTLTAIEPAMCIMASSAWDSARVTIQAPKMSGRDIPSATIVIAVTTNNTLELTGRNSKN